MPTTNMAYLPTDYWPRLVSGNGALDNVGQAALGDYNRYAYRRRLEALDRALTDLPLANARVFEAGFGEGVYLTEWRRRRARSVAGLDLSPRAATAARERFPGYDLRAGDLTRCDDFEAFGEFDFVTAIDVLYHIVDDLAWTRAMDHLLERVAPGGFFIFSDKFPDQGAWQSFPHVRRRSLATWEARLARFGLEVMRRVPVFVLMDDPIPTAGQRGLSWLTSLQWRVLTKPIRMTRRGSLAHRVVTGMVAAAQAPLERVLVRTLARTPNTELVVAQRVMSPTRGR